MSESEKNSSYRSGSEVSDVTIDQLMPLDDPQIIADQLPISEIRTKILTHIDKAADLRLAIQEAKNRLIMAESRLATLYEAHQIAQDKNPGV